MNISRSVTRASVRISLLAMSVLLSQSLLLSGCASRSALMVQEVEQNTSDQQLIQQVMEALKSTEARLARAHADNVDVFAPGKLDDATSALREARRYSDRFQADPDLVNKSVSLFMGDTLGREALQLIASANTALDQAEQTKQEADIIFADANENFVWLNKFQARLYFQNEYEDLVHMQQRLVKAVAAGRMETARDGLPRLLLEQRALEIAAAQRFYLYDLSFRIEQESRGSVERHAPISYSSAVGALSKARSVVASNPRKEEQILAAKAEAEFAIGMAHAVAADMKELSRMDRQEMERWLILLTTKLREIGRAVGANDVRDQEVLKQLDLLVAASAGDDTVADKTAQVTKAETVAAAPAPAKSEAAAPAADDGIRHRMNELEQSIRNQIKALSDQITAMKQVDVSVSAAPAADVSVSGN